MVRTKPRPPRDTEWRFNSNQLGTSNQKLKIRREDYRYATLKDLMTALFDGKGDLELYREGTAVFLRPRKRRKLFVGGLADTTQEQLHDYFSDFGTVSSAETMYDRYDGSRRGFGFMTFEANDDALNALEKQHHSIHQRQRRRGKGLRVPQDPGMAWRATMLCEVWFLL